ncbi:MAG: glycosyltransferase family 2 protein [Bacteroidales bacterium]|nr:glycosyltransferase family 2 protein [Bacteroidales bacterium]
MPAVSVIIPVYKVEPYMARCARSLFGQTLPDLEFLFIDDCSPDRSIEVMREVLEGFPQRKQQVTVFRMPQNSGQAAVRMQGMALAQGEYVIHCDSDDYVDINAYATLYGKAKAEDLDIVTCDITVEQDGRAIERITGECTSAFRMLQGKERWNLVCRMIRRTLCEGITAPTADMGEDMVVSVQAQLKARRTGHVDQSLYFYCYREDSITKRESREDLVARQESLTENARLMIGLLEDRYGYTGDEPEILHFKYKCREILTPLVHLPAYYRHWKETFPEVDRKVLPSRAFSMEEKFWFVLIHLRLYHPVKRVTGWFRNQRRSDS